ncbi:MAG TPA: hypothetical protein VFN97_26060 [Actinospica sp.]|nr:hypothetical protein [Actinospica sp.]
MDGTPAPTWTFLTDHNRYAVATGTRFRHAAEADHEIAGLLALINGSSRWARKE